MESGAISSAAIDDAVRGYQDALVEGDRVLGAGSIERRVLHSMVTASAANLATWIATRTPDGEQRAEPVDALVRRLSPGDTVSTVVQKVQTWLGTQLAQAVAWAVLGAKAPVGFGIVVAIAVGAMGFAFDAGLAIGTAVAAGAVPSGAAMYAIRVALTNAPKDLPGASELFPDPVARAEMIFLRNVQPVLVPVYATQGAVPGPPPLAAKVRGATNLALGCLYFTVVIAVGFAVVGVSEGYAAYQESLLPQQQCTPTRQALGLC